MSKPPKHPDKPLWGRRPASYDPYRCFAFVPQHVGTWLKQRAADEGRSPGGLAALWVQVLHDDPQAMADMQAAIMRRWADGRFRSF